MKFLTSTIFILAILLALSSCEKDKIENSDLSFDSIPVDRYYETDILLELGSDFYGKWKFDFSSGTISGGGYPLDFDYLLLKPNAIFGILRNDSLIMSGSIEIENISDGKYKVQFQAKENPKEENIILTNLFRTIELEDDKLNLISDCCDQANEHFTKE